VAQLAQVAQVPLLEGVAAVCRPCAPTAALVDGGRVYGVATAAGPVTARVEGDAAAVLDPASSHGVLKAIASGVMASHLLAAVLCGGVPGASASAAYQDWLTTWFDTDAARLARFYGDLGVEGFHPVG
jgi:flavin-dependent dehydrogenase